MSSPSISMVYHARNCMSLGVGPPSLSPMISNMGCQAELIQSPKLADRTRSAVGCSNSSASAAVVTSTPHSRKSPRIHCGDSSVFVPLLHSRQLCWPKPGWRAEAGAEPWKSQAPTGSFSQPFPRSQDKRVSPVNQHYSLGDLPSSLPSCKLLGSLVPITSRPRLGCRP